MRGRPASHQLACCCDQQPAILEWELPVVDQVPLPRRVSRRTRWLAPLPGSITTSNFACLRLQSSQISPLFLMIAFYAVTPFFHLAVAESSGSEVADVAPTSSLVVDKAFSANPLSSLHPAFLAFSTLKDTPHLGASSSTTNKQQALRWIKHASRCR